MCYEKYSREVDLQQQYWNKKMKEETEPLRLACILTEPFGERHKLDL
jgi:hypothetical protein